MNKLPYEEKLSEYGKKGKILGRNDIYGSGPPSSVVSLEVLELIKRYSDNNILDIGCGIGACIKALSREGYECEGLEHNKEYVKACLNQGLKVKWGSACRLPYKDNSFDTVLFIEVLEHINDPLKALEEAFRVAKNKVIVSVPNIEVIPTMSLYQVVPWHLLEATHLNFFTPRILEKSLKKFAKKTEVRTYGRFAPWIQGKEINMHILGVGWKR